GPDGGDGGAGGDVWLVADRNVGSLLAFRDHPFRRATNGTHGSGKKKHGARGHDIEVHVPEGTVVLDADGQVVADLTTAGARWLAAAGGQGGHGNARFLSNKRRAPAFAEQGEVGEEHWYRLELKLLADVALVGFPNVGKSTFIATVSAARPKIADYPFTTLEPNLGVVRIDDTTDIVVADIPGLIEGAAEGRGLGHRFLRHVERARALLVLVDLGWRDAGLPDPEEQERVLLAELGAYRPELLDRPRIVAGSRADLSPPEGQEEGPALRFSAATGAGVKAVVGALAEAVSRARAEEPTPTAFVVHRPVADEGVTVERAMDGGWNVLGRAAARAVALSDITNAGALEYAQSRLTGLGIDRALARAGAAAGDVVRIGTFEFTYHPDDEYEGRPR
nr:GTPase ObgE [Acidimicrobiia bacterium]